MSLLERVVASWDPPSNNNGESMGFRNPIKLIALASLLGVLMQNVYNYFQEGQSFNVIGTLGAILLVIGFLYLWGKSLMKIIHTPFFAISCILGIAIATAIGTFVTQNAAPEVFSQRYGQSGSKLLRFFEMDQVFHSWWYVVLFLLLTVSLIKISLKRSFTLPNAGFHLAHFGPVIILFGFWWDYYAGFRGLIQLVKGKETNHVWVYHPNTNRVRDSLKLDFNLLLDHFETEKFEPDHRIQVWKENADNSNPVIVTTLPLQIGTTNTLYKSDIQFELKEFYPNFYMQYDYPEKIDTIQPNNSGILFEVTTPHGGDLVQLRTDIPGKNIMNEPILGSTFEFYWSLPDDIENNIKRFNPNSQFAKRNRVIFSGEEEKIYEVFEANLEEKTLETGKAFLVPGKRTTVYTVVFLCPDIAYLTSQPSTRNNLQDNPVAKIEVRRESWSDPRDAFIYPAESGTGGQFNIPDSEFILALESIKDKETKFWRSDLSIINNQGKVEKQQSIKVNEPLSHRGYRFYQTDYDPNNPNYSGIGVSYAPGLNVIYFGFYLLVAGVFILFYLRKRQHI